MAVERWWPAYAPSPFTSNGAQNGVVTVANTLGLYTKMKVRLYSNTTLPSLYQVKSVLSQTQVQIGPVTNPSLTAFSDLTAFLVSDNATIDAARQEIPPIKPDDIFNAIYAREPAVALRTLGVDPYGVPYSSSNPMPVLATITVPPNTIPSIYTAIYLSYDTNNNLTLVQFYNGVPLIRTITLGYDTNNNLTSVLAS